MRKIVLMTPNGMSSIVETELEDSEIQTKIDELENEKFLKEVEEDIDFQDGWILEEMFKRGYFVMSELKDLSIVDMCWV